MSVLVRIEGSCRTVWRRFDRVIPFRNDVGALAVEHLHLQTGDFNSAVIEQLFGRSLRLVREGLNELRPGLTLFTLTMVCAERKAGIMYADIGISGIVTRRQS